MPCQRSPRQRRAACLYTWVLSSPNRSGCACPRSHSDASRTARKSSSGQKTRRRNCRRGPPLPTPRRVRYFSVSRRLSFMQLLNGGPHNIGHNKLLRASIRVRRDLAKQGSHEARVWVTRQFLPTCASILASRKSLPEHLHFSRFHLRLASCADRFETHVECGGGISSGE